MPPEYVESGFVSKKFDVFSLGVVIIKMMAGNMGYFCRAEKSPKDFIEHVREIYTLRCKISVVILVQIICLYRVGLYIHTSLSHFTDLSIIFLREFSVTILHAGN